MKLKVFGILAEQIGQTELDIPFFENTNTLWSHLRNEYPVVNSTPCVLAVNKQVATDDISLKEWDELALLPPFSGG